MEGVEVVGALGAEVHDEVMRRVPLLEEAVHVLLGVSIAGEAGGRV